MMCTGVDQGPYYGDTSFQLSSSPIQQRQFLATATPGQSFPTAGGQHIDVVHLTTADVQNSSGYRLLEAAAPWQLCLGLDKNSEL